jgi:hypothetical protein
MPQCQNRLDSLAIDADAVMQLRPGSHQNREAVSRWPGRAKHKRPARIAVRNNLNRNVDRGELWVFHITGVAGPDRLEHQNVSLFVGRRPMLDASGNDA